MYEIKIKAQSVHSIDGCKILAVYTDVVQKVQSLVLVGGGEFEWFNQVKCPLSSNTVVEKSNCTGEERHPVSFLVAAELDHSAAKTPPQNVHCICFISTLYTSNSLPFNISYLIHFNKHNRGEVLLSICIKAIFVSFFFCTPHLFKAVLWMHLCCGCESSCNGL